MRTRQGIAQLHHLLGLSIAVATMLCRCVGMGNDCCGVLPFFFPQLRHGNAPNTALLFHYMYLDKRAACCVTRMHGLSLRTL
jgi:hypothetical protein